MLWLNPWLRFKVSAGVVTATCAAAKGLAGACTGKDGALCKALGVLLEPLIAEGVELAACSALKGVRQIILHGSNTNTGKFAGADRTSNWIISMSCSQWFRS